MAFVINGGGDKGANFQHFTDLCCSAYQELRGHTNLIINLLELVGRVGGVGGRGSQVVGVDGRDIESGKGRLEGSLLIVQ